MLEIEWFKMLMRTQKQKAKLLEVIFPFKTTPGYFLFLRVYILIT